MTPIIRTEIIRAMISHTQINAMPRTTLQTRLLTGTFTLLLIAASRLLLLAGLSFDHDEVWSVWQTFGTPQEIVARTPFDWPPLYYLTVGAWRLFVGIHPVALRMSSVLLFLLSAALTYQLARKLFHSERAAWLVMLAYAGLGYVVYLSILLRAYAFVLMLLPLGLILVMRYFERPTILRGVWLGLCMAVMFYLTLSAVFGFLVMGVFSLFLYPRHIWRWWLPGLVALLVASIEIRNKLGMVATRTAVELNLTLPPLPQAFAQIYRDYSGAAFWIWLILIVVAMVLILFGRNVLRPYEMKSGQKIGVARYAPTLIFILVWIVLSPVLLYVIHTRTNFFGARYSWWIAPGIALWIGYGLSRLPKMAATIAGIVLIVLLFVPQDITAYKERSPNFEQNFAWLADQLQPGDVLLLDPNCSCGRLEQWDYYMRVYFQNDLRLIHSVSDAYQRIWYVRTRGAEDADLFNAVQANRAPGLFSGAPNFFFQLYSLPPDVEGILFEYGLRFHGVEVLDEDGIETAQILRPEGSKLRLRLWWSVDEPLTQEYSVGVQVINNRTRELLTQADSAPLAIHLNPFNTEPLPPNMLAWQPHVAYLEERTLEIPYGLRRENFTVYLTVYDWRDGKRFSAEGVNADNLLPLFEFDVMAW